MLISLIKRAHLRITLGLAWFGQKLTAWTQPTLPALVLETVADLTRNKSALLLENALLCHQLIILKRSVKRPKLTNTDGAY